jgi:hypothetical protein
LQPTSPQGKNHNGKPSDHKIYSETPPPPDYLYSIVPIHLERQLHQNASLPHSVPVVDGIFDREMCRENLGGEAWIFP